MDRPWKLKVFQETSQIEQMTSLVVSKVARLWLYTETYTGKDEYKDRYPFKERSSEHKRGQQRHSTPKGQTMATKDN